MKVETWCGSCQDSDPISIQINSEAVADFVIQESWKMLRSAREDVAAALRQDPSFAPRLLPEDRFQVALNQFDAFVAESLRALHEKVGEYPQSPRAVAFLHAVRESIRLHIHNAAMAELSEITGIMRTTLNPSEFAAMIAEPLTKTLRDQLQVRRGGPRGYLPPDDDAVWPRFSARTRELRPLWVKAREAEQAPPLDGLSPDHQKRLRRAFYHSQKKLKPLSLALLQAGAEYNLWDLSRKRLPHEALAKRFRTHSAAR